MAKTKYGIVDVGEFIVHRSSDAHPQPAVAHAHGESPFDAQDALGVPVHSPEAVQGDVQAERGHAHAHPLA